MQILGAAKCVEGNFSHWKLEAGINMRPHNVLQSSLQNIPFSGANAVDSMKSKCSSQLIVNECVQVPSWGFYSVLLCI